MTINLYNGVGDIHANQCIYDSFNDFIFSNDRNVFNKMMARHQFYKMTEHVHGDIVECGVFKGSGLLTWLKLVDLYEPHSIKKVIGLDFFGPAFVDDLSDEIDRETMKQVFSRDKSLSTDDVSLGGIHQKIVNAGFKADKFELVKGDVSETSRRLVEERPGFRISVLYLDMDIYQPTYDALVNLWDRISPGGIIVFDEHAYHSWSEAHAVDQFAYDMGLIVQKTKIKAPTGFIVK